MPARRIRRKWTLERMKKGSFDLPFFPLPAVRGIFEECFRFTSIGSCLAFRAMRRFYPLNGPFARLIILDRERENNLAEIVLDRGG